MNAPVLLEPQDGVTVEGLQTITRFAWQSIPNVIAYFVTVQIAEALSVFRVEEAEMTLGNAVAGTGLWSVRAVAADGRHTPSSEKRSIIYTDAGSSKDR